jgi:hypothetical protein
MVCVYDGPVRFQGSRFLRAAIGKAIYNKALALFASVLWLLAGFLWDCALG